MNANPPENIHQLVEMHKKRLALLELQAAKQ
jgi:hypothetical protein